MMQKKNNNIQFVRIACKHCSEDQIVFTRATTRIKCFHCGSFLSIPKGGKCKFVDSKVVENLK